MYTIMISNREKNMYGGIEQLSKEVADGESQISPCWSEGYRRGRRKGQNDPFGNKIRNISMD